MLFILFFLLNSSIVCVTMVFLVPLPCKHPLHTPNTKVHQQGCTFVFGIVPSPYSTRRTRKDTNEGVFSCSALFLRPTLHAEREETPSLVSFRVSALFLRPTLHAEREKTPSLVSFRVRRCSFALLHMLNAKRHQRGCLFVFGVVISPYTTCRMRKDTNEGVFSCSASLLHLTTHAEHDNTPSLVLFRARILSCPLKGVC